MKCFLIIIGLIIILALLSQFGILLPEDIGEWLGKVVYGIENVK